MIKFINPITLLEQICGYFFEIDQVSQQRLVVILVWFNRKPFGVGLKTRVRHILIGKYTLLVIELYGWV